MMLISLFTVLKAAVFLKTINAKYCENFDLVDPFIGSSGAGFGYGSVNPAAQVPYGAMRLGPDTTFVDVDVAIRHISGYNYYDPLIRAFSHTRLEGAGLADLGNFGIMPQRLLSAEEVESAPVLNSWWSPYSKITEKASPGHYSAFLKNPNVQAKLVAASTHSGVHFYEFMSDSSKNDDAEGGKSESYYPALVVDACNAVTSASYRTSPCLNASIDVNAEEKSFSASVLFSGPLSNWLESAPTPRTSMMLYMFGQIVVPEGMVLQSWHTCSSDGKDSENNVQCIENAASGASTNGVMYSRLVFKPTDASSVSVGASMDIEVQVGLSFVSSANAKQNLLSALSPHIVGARSSAVTSARVGPPLVYALISEQTTSLWCDELDDVKLDISSDSFANAVNYKSIFLSSYYR
jgi:hypothetical protein